MHSRSYQVPLCRTQQRKASFFASQFNDIILNCWNRSLFGRSRSRRKLLQRICNFTSSYPVPVNNGSREDEAFLCCVLHRGTWYDRECMFLECLRCGESLSLLLTATLSWEILYIMTRRASLHRSSRLQCRVTQSNPSGLPLSHLIPKFTPFFCTYF
jgi:hypothetical protein